MTSGNTYCKLSIEETAQKLHTSVTEGLESQQEVSYRRSVNGSNVLEQEDEESPFWGFVAQFYEDPLVLMLIVSAGISLLLGNKEDAISITLAIVFVVGVGSIQEYRSEQSLKALNNLVPPSAHLIRSGHSSTVLASTLVPGDLVSFEVGDRIPADVRIVKASHLCVDESSLTGENEPVEKSVNVVDHAFNDIPIAERHNIAFMGTLVTSGHGAGIVVGTGRDTEFGTIFFMMSEIDKPKTPLQISMAQLGKDLSMISFVVIGVICIIGVFQGRSLLEMFQIGVSLAVAAIPEGLPIIVTVTLALGVLHMARKNAIVRRLPSVETLGCVNVVCSDKTGTLTRNKLTVNKIFTPDSEKWIDMRGHSSPSPAVGMLLTAGNMCNNARRNTEKNIWMGNPVDIALIMALEAFGREDSRDTVKRVSDTPFNSTRKWMATHIKNSSGDDWIYVKGAMERIIPMCSYYTNAQGEPEEITEKIKESAVKHADAEAEKGMRILALAYKHKDADIDNPEDLVFAGLIAMNDPPRPGVKNSVRKLTGNGVRVIMVTGDNELTAISAAREVGLPIPYGNDVRQFVMNGSTLEKLDANQLSHAIQNVLIFARTSPELKVKIVEALQKRGHVVAMTGDGVNDAPALKLADIGIAMGSGTDVAKEAGDMILVDDDFSTILVAISQGKAIFTNIKSFLSFQLSTSVAALLLIAVATLFGFPNPLNPMQILWINILMDGPPAQSLGVEPVGPEVMSKPPRNRSEPVLTRIVLRRVVFRGVMILAGTLFVYIREMSADKEVTARDTTMSFTCFVFFDLFNALASRSAERSIFEIGLFSNSMFNASVGLSLLGQLLVIYFPPLQRVFQTEALSFRDLLLLTAISSSIWWVDEIRKYQARRSRVDVDPASRMV